jgi:hypothetical protein
MMGKQTMANTLMILLFASFMTACGVAPTRIGEGIRSAIDSTEDKRPASDQKIIFKQTNP